MPIETDHLDRLRLAAWNLASLQNSHERHQHDDADGDVNSVESGQNEEAGAEEAGGEAHSLVVEGGELIHLTTDEGRAEQPGDCEPQSHVAIVVLVCRGYRKHHRQGAHQEHEAADRGERNVKDLRRGRTLAYSTSIQHVGGNEATKQQAFRPKEEPHAQLDVGQTRRGVVCRGISRHGRLPLTNLRVGRRHHLVRSTARVPNRTYQAG